MYQVLTEILETSAALYPERPALRCQQEELSYAELSSRVSRMVAVLRDGCLAHGDRVAVVLPKSIDAVVAFLATLQAGGVYVPVDRFQPVARASHILRDCSCSLLITDRDFFDSLRREGMPERLQAIIQAEVGPAERPGPGPFCERMAPDNLAFILYTSGSTGLPKGVRITHRNLLTFINWCIGRFELRPSDVFSNHAAFSFDLSTFDLYAALAVGACVHILTEEEMKNPFALARQIEGGKISVWYSVPSILMLMLSADVFRKYDCSSLRYVLFAGEVFPIKRLKELIAALPAPNYYNLYGPTETNVCTYYEVKPSDSSRVTPVPIGRPLPGLSARVVDRTGEPVERGEVGELVIEGACVTPGYFGPTPSRNEANHRCHIHATGDLVSVDEDGELNFRGRIDNMVKVNGYRVELGEIESQLALHPALENVIVVPLETDGQTSLVACYTSAEGHPPLSLIEMKKFCAARLPAYMIPHRLRRFDSLPVNQNGKFSRRALELALKD